MSLLKKLKEVSIDDQDIRIIKELEVYVNNDLLTNTFGIFKEVILFQLVLDNSIKYLTGDICSRY